MEAQWQADRSMLRTLLRTQPAWTQRDYAEAIGRSVAWVKKWAKRLRAACAAPLSVLHRYLYCTVIKRADESCGCGVPHGRSSRRAIYGTQAHARWHTTSPSAK